MSNTPAKNVCQYWVEEPGVCSHWDETIPMCTYEGTDDQGGTTARSEYYPYCNMLGTQCKCNQYDGNISERAYRCVLPDPERSVGNRQTGQPWATLPTWSNGEVIEAGNFDDITEYNDGDCDSHGTAGKCSGYMPYHLGFSSLQPDDTAGSLGYDEDGALTSVSGEGLTFRLPLSYKIYNYRAELSRCYWWKAAPTEFTVDDDGVIESIIFRCTNPDEITTLYSDFKWDATNNMYRAPCNGCKAECPRYTGVCWEYCTDDNMRQGDKILAEQILELRYYLRKEKWDPVEYEKSFYEPDIQAWLGSVDFEVTDANGEQRSLIPSRRAYISDFDLFTIGTDDSVLSAGTPSEDRKREYPDLVRELRDFTLTPIIRNQFDNMDINGEDIGYNIFEASDIEHKYVLIFGDSFWYNYETYGINLSDPDLNFLPIELKDYNNMSEIEVALGDGFDDFYNKLDYLLDFMKDAMSDKMIASEFGKDQNMFYINMPTQWGDNDVIVLNKGAGSWEFDKISFKKIFVGGVIGQTGFELIGSGDIDYLPAYDSDFSAYLNNNGSIDFSFFPLISYDYGDYGLSMLYYMYLDGVRQRLAANPAIVPDNETYELTYKLYKITVAEDLEIDMNNIKFFGNGGYALVVIPDEEDENKILSHAIKPWEIEGKLKLYYEAPSENDLQGEWIEMEFYEKCNSRLETNQFIIRPKSMSEFKAVCKDSYLYIEKLYTYERRTMETPSADNYEIDRESFIDEDDAISYRENFQVTKESNNFQLRKFGYEPLMASIVYRGITGRIKGHIKTKLITWVRQPYCRDVEINYSWQAGYTKYVLLPEYNCYGPTGIRADVNTHYASYTPYCGDHDLGFISSRGPMWYPYTSCEDVARYEIYGNLTEWDIRVMEVFWDDYPADPAHGYHDMRMLGPADHFGYTCDTHAHLWSCTCDWSFCNLDKKTQNIFAGFGRYRGGMSQIDKAKAVANGGSLPKFGNTYRDFLRSYRSIDNIDYYFWNGSLYQRKRRWVPMPEFYTFIDMNKSASDYPYLLYCSNDFYDDGSYFIHPMGLMLAEQSVENISINEAVKVEYLDTPVRYRFEEVFETHSSTAGLYYPYPRNPYLKLVGAVPVPIISWYTYKDAPGEDTDKSIQWAWQEHWDELERYGLDDTNVIYEDHHYKGQHKVLEGTELLEEKLVNTYVENGNEVLGKHIFLNLTYPDYEYDYEIFEHRLVCDEGDQEIHIVAPTPIGLGNYEGAYWKLQLNSGPPRCFDMDGSWVNEIGCSGTLYSTCTQTPWVEDVTLFDTGYTSVTPNSSRTITTYDGAGYLVETYYQRGLFVEILSENLGFLPRKIKLLDSTYYEFKFDKLADIIEEGESNDWSYLEDLSQFYPAECQINVKYSINNNELNIITKFDEALSLGALSIDFGFGAIESEEDMPRAKGLVWAGKLYHIPGIVVYKSDDGVNFEEIYNLDFMYLAGKDDLLTTERCFYDLVSDDPADLIDCYKYIKISFRMDPSTNEIGERGSLSDYFELSTTDNIIDIKAIYLYYNEFVDATEEIYVWERKYNISTGHHGDFPPHGYESTGSLLYPTPNDRSTVYQYDTIGGVVGMPSSQSDNETMNKIRGRILKACHADKEPLEGSKNLYKWEDRQKEIHDEIAINSGSTEFTMTGYPPPAIKLELDKAGIVFPSWVCTFKNTVVRPLLSVQKSSPYSPCGHRFKWDFENMYRYHACGAHGSIFGRRTADVFEYVFEHVCTGDLGWSQMDAIVAYYRGVGKLLVNPFSYLGGEQSRNDEINSAIAGWRDSVVMDLPSAIDNLN